MIKLERFMGIAPRYAPQQLPERASQVAKNCRFDAMALRPMRGLGDPIPGMTTLPAASSLFLYERSGSILLSFEQDTDVVRSPIARDAWGRIYVSNGSQPKMRVAGSSTLWDLGIQIPSSAGVSATVNSVGRTSEDPLDASVRTYVLTYVSSYDEEGPPSQPITSDDVYPGDIVDLSGLPTVPSTGQHSYDRKRLYRVNVGSLSTEFQLVATLPIATTSFSDDVPNDSLGIVLPSTLWDAPPDGIKGFVSHPAGFIAGFKGRTVYVSEQYLPHAWPYSYAMSEEIVALAVYGNTILVLTTGMPILLTGSDPGSLSTEKTETSMACTSKRGVVDMGDVIVYPSPEGLVVGGIGPAPTVATTLLMGKEEWEKYTPGTILAAQWERKYVAFCQHVDKGPIAFMFDPATQDISEVTVGDIKACLYDHISGALGVRVGTETGVRLFGEGDILSYTWRSKVFRMSHPENYGAAQVYAEDFPVTLKLYGDGGVSPGDIAPNPHHTVVINSNNPVRLPSGYLADRWEVQLEGKASVNAVHIAPTMRQLKDML